MRQDYSLGENSVNPLCSGCGACVSESQGNLKVGIDNQGFLIPVSIDGSPSDDVLKVCPFNGSPETSVGDEDVIAEKFLFDATSYDDDIGKYTDTYVGYSVEFRKTSSSGGLATYVFEQLLKRGVVDALFIVSGSGGSYSYQFFEDFSDIKSISKTRYIPVTFDGLFEKLSSFDGRVAVSGVACFIKALRLKQHYSPDLLHKIPFSVGIICGGLKSYGYTDYLAQSAGLVGEYHSQEYRVKDESSDALDYAFSAKDSSHRSHSIKMRSLGDMWGTGLFKAMACDFCSDVTTELADISLGDAWLPEYKSDGLGNSVVITRSRLADIIIKEGIEAGELLLKRVDKSVVIKSQAPSFKHRRDALKFRISIYRLFGLESPPVRKRVLKPISLSYSLVQLARMLTRYKSNVIWQDVGSSDDFEKRMFKYKFILKIFTKIDHWARKE